MFIGRKRELALLNDLTRKKVASFVVIKGRRRIGKSTLIKEFCKPYNHYIFSGLPPTSKSTLTSQLNEFSHQISRQLNTPFIPFQDFSDAFWFLADKVKTDRIVIVLDEISWLGSLDPDFLGKLKNIWDLNFKNNSKLILIVCGSVSAWIEKNILCSTGFVGRISLNIHLTELSLFESNMFWNKHKNLISSYEKFKILSITGGVPRYLEEIIITDTAEDNIKRICFTPEGFLFNEFDQIFYDTFLRKSDVYKKIILSLVDSPKEAKEIANIIQYNQNNAFSEYLHELELAGFIARDFTWQIIKKNISKISQYRIKDNYLRFYLKYIYKNKNAITKGSYNYKNISSAPNWQSIMGFQFENLVLNNRQAIWNILNISPDDVIFDNPYYQRKTTKQNGCQIDYMIQTKFNTLYLCEIKFSKNIIKSNIIKEVKQKIDSLNAKKNFSIRPVLINVCGVSEDVENSEFFAKIIDFGILLI